MSEPDYNKALAYAYTRLSEDLSPDLTYHNLWHTQQGVVPASINLGQLSGVIEKELRLLEVAGAYHDIGFTEHYAAHELASARIAAQVLPKFGFDSPDIERIMGMIIATRLPQSPRTQLEEILVDADLDVLGRNDFMARNHALRQELANFGPEIELRSWYEGQLAFLASHQYFTPAAQMLRGNKKKENYHMLEELLQKID